MSSAPNRPFAFSLRVRVAAWIAGAVLLCGVLLLALIREGVRQALLHELDVSLHAEADEILLVRAQHLTDPQQIYETMKNQARGHRDATSWSMLLSSDGRPEFATIAAPKKMLRTTRFEVPQTIEGYRVLEHASSDGQAIVQVGSSLTIVNADMAQIDQLVAVGALSVFLVAPMAGFLLATVSLRPISEMSERTSQLQPHALGARLPLRGANDELDRLAAVINNLLGRIEQYVGEHRGLMADAAHQLRTPLAAIRSTAEVVLADDGITEANRESLERVIEQIESLETLVNQLLLLAETEVDHLNLGSELVRLDDLVRGSLDMFDAVAESLDVKLEVGRIAFAEIQGNRHHLRQVVNNLIDNAMKFTAIKDHEPRRVSVQLNRDDSEGLVRLAISDTGIGIAAEKLPHIFSRFYRAESVERSEAGVRGNGLGLSIVKSVIESHGGQVTVQSSPGVGTTFIVSLPLARAEVLANT